MRLWSRPSASATVASRSLADLFSCLQSLDVPRELRRGRCGDARRDCYVVKGLGEVSQGRGDDLLRFAGAERVPVFGFADEVRDADAAVVEAAVDGEREVAVDPDRAVLEEVRDGIVDVGEHAAAGKVQDGQVL